jgi:hypothetical protein
MNEAISDSESVGGWRRVEGWRELFNMSSYKPKEPEESEIIVLGLHLEQI